LADNAAQSGLRELRRRVQIIFNFAQSAIGIHDFEIANRIYFHRHVVLVMMSCGGTSSVTMRSGIR